MNEPTQIKFDDFNGSAADARYHGKHRRGEWVTLDYRADPTTVEVDINDRDRTEPICRTLKRDDVRKVLSDEFRIDVDAVEWKAPTPPAPPADPRAQGLWRRREAASISAALPAELVGLGERAFCQLEREYWRFENGDVEFLDRLYSLIGDRREAIRRRNRGE